MRIARLLLLAIAVGSPAGPARPAQAGQAPAAGSQPAPAEPTLADGIRQVSEGDFETAVVTLGAVTRALETTGGPAAAQAYLHLAIAQLALDRRDDALARFGDALRHQPTLRLSADRHSPKVLAAFEEARRARENALRAGRSGAATAEGKRGSGTRTALVLGGVAAAGVGVVLATRGGDEGNGTVTFTAARFGTPVLECPNDTLGEPLLVFVDLNAQNGSGRAVTISSVSAVLRIVASPGNPGEVGFASNQPATVAPATLPGGATALRVQTTLTCANGANDAPRVNQWKGYLTLTTSSGAHTIETADMLQVNLP